MYIKKVKNFFKTEFVSASFLSAISTFVKLLTGFATSKIVAILIGPAGLGLLGQLASFSTIAQTFSNGGISTGLVKYVSEYKEKKSFLRRVVSTGMIITLICSSVATVTLLVFSEYFSNLIFENSKYAIVFKIFGVTINFFAFNKFLLALVNGVKKFKLFNKINIISSIVGLLFTFFLVLKFQVLGALIASISFQSLVVVIAIYFIKKEELLTIDLFRGRFNKVIGSKLLIYSLNTLIAVISVPIVQILIRNIIRDKVGAVEVGYYEGIIRISNLILMFVTTSLTTYYLPRLAEINDAKTLKKEVINTLKIISPIVFLGCMALYLLREFVIRILFSEEFINMEVLFAPQLLGDFFKILTWILAFQFVAKGRMMLNIGLNLGLSLTFYLLSNYFIDVYGIVGVSYAHLINYIFYGIILLILLRKQLFSI